MDKEAEYNAKCKALERVFVTVSGAFNERGGGMDYYGRREELQERVAKELQSKNTNGVRYPLTLREGLDPNNIWSKVE